ncbi:MAG: N-acetyltransferase [bacterium]|nr:N-acetyltransferase [bacterium]MDE0241186.1 N-acetyltransferase [bacterium]MDE0415959.1 N-acetyltransferase [bacterium]
MPDLIPIIPPGQLAADEALRGRRLGSDLLTAAARRPFAAARVAGARALFGKLGFIAFSDREPLMLARRMSRIEGSLRSWCAESEIRHVMKRLPQRSPGS